MIAEAGSRAGTGGTSTSPAPSIPRLVDPLEPVPRVPPRDAVRPDPEVPDPPGADAPEDAPPCPLGRDGPDEPGRPAAGGAAGDRVVTAAPAGAGTAARAGFGACAGRTWEEEAGRGAETGCEAEPV